MLIHPVLRSERAVKNAGLCFAFLFLSASVLYCYQILCFPLPAVLAVAVLFGAAMFKWKLHRSVAQNSLPVHLISLCTVFFSMQPPDSFHTMMNEFWILMTGLSSMIFFFGISELLFAIPVRLFGREPHPELFRKCFLICLVPCFTVLLFLPSETYFVNRGQMQYGYLKFAPHYLLITLLLALALTSAVCSLRQAWIRRFCCGLTGLLCCVYGQYMFMNKNLPVIGAETADWDSMTGAYILNGAIWLLLFTLPFLAERLLRRKGEDEKAVPGRILLFAGALGGIQLITLLILFVTAPPAVRTVGVKCPSGKEQFTVSANQNIITVILDEADQLYFEEAYAEQPERFDFLRDFTYYTNTAMLYDSTYLSIPAMLTAAGTLPETDVSAWYAEICAAEPAKLFYKRLKDADYRVNAFGEFAYFSDYTPFQDMLDNLSDLTPDSTSVDTDMLYGKIRQMIAYRALPLCLKQFTEPSGTFGNEAVSVKDGCIIDNDVFLDHLNLTLSESTENYFTVQHLMGMHSYEEEDLEDCLNILETYFRQLKRLGVYDDALIIVTADHGVHSEPMNMPIWYIKKPHETGEQLRFCSAPISLTDYAATVLDSMGLWQNGDEALFGKPISAWQEDDVRTRLVFQRRTFQNDGKTADGTDDSFFGYYFTGTKQDLMKHEQSDPPDVILYLKDRL